MHAEHHTGREARIRAVEEDEEEVTAPLSAVKPESAEESESLLTAVETERASELSGREPDNVANLHGGQADSSGQPDHMDAGTPAGVTPLVIDLRSGDPIVVLPKAPESGLLAASKLQRTAKRTLDVVGAGAGLILLSPLILAIASAVKLSSPGPVLYVSERIGEGGKPFRFLKFRTMWNDADGEKDQLIDLNEVDGPIFKMQEDPRITPVGRFLRRFSLDELPQLVHVLSGKMSLVGPRPPIPEEVAQYTEYQLQRLTVKPGLTCIWQVSGRSTLDFDTWVALDLQYIENWSLRQDLMLLVQTVPAVLTGRGAY